MGKYQLTVQVDSLAELADLTAYLSGWRTRQVDQVPTVHVPPDVTDVRACSGGHGPMRLIPGGTAKSGPRIGQPYPPFWKCDTCGERREVTA